MKIKPVQGRVAIKPEAKPEIFHGIHIPENVGEDLRHSYAIVIGLPDRIEKGETKLRLGDTVLYDRDAPSRLDLPSGEIRILSRGDIKGLVTRSLSGKEGGVHIQPLDDRVFVETPEEDVVKVGSLWVPGNQKFIHHRPTKVIAVSDQVDKEGLIRPGQRVWIQQKYAVDIVTEHAGLFWVIRECYVTAVEMEGKK